MHTSTSPAPASASAAPASPSPQTILTTGAAPAAPVYVIPNHEADDATLRLAEALGFGADLGLTTAQTATSPAPTPEATAEPEVIPAPETPAPEPTETPEAKIARLEAELAAAKNVSEGKEPPSAGAAVPPSPPIVAPTPENPLANLRNPEHLSQAERVASDFKAWAIQNREGGEIPVALAQQVENVEALREGRQPVTITEPILVGAKAAATIESSADRMLTQFVPARREFLQRQGQFIESLRSDAPDFLDPKKEQGQVFQNLAANYPQLLTVPEWPLILRDLATGYLANKAKPAAPAKTAATKPAAATVADTTGKIIPMAPAAPLGGLGIGGPPISQQRLEQAQERLNRGEHSDEDLQILSAAAV